MLIEHPSIIGEDLPYYSNKVTLNFLHAYIDENSQRLIYEYPGDGLQAITRLKYQCANVNFYENIRYNITFQQVVHKGGESEINYINIFQNAKAL